MYGWMQTRQDDRLSALPASTKVGNPVLCVQPGSSGLLPAVAAWTVALTLRAGTLTTVFATDGALSCARSVTTAHRTLTVTAARTLRSVQFPTLFTNLLQPGILFLSQDLL